MASKGTSECEMDGDQIAELMDHLGLFMEPYLPLFGRRESKGHARMYVEGRLQQLGRRTLEPIANEHGVHRRPLQFFVGAGDWDDRPVMDRLCEDVACELGASDGVFVMDGSGFPKWGDKSVGVQRQWCGRLGKKENCQVGEFLAYASHKGHTLVDGRLYLPKTWASDRTRRKEAHVPSRVKFRKGWQLAYEMVQQRATVLPHRWVLGDDAYGRVVELRDGLDGDEERYLLEVPGNTQVVVVGREEDGQRSVAAVANGTPRGDWQRVRTRDGEKGPIEVRAVKMRVATKRGRELGRRETLLIVTRSTGERWYYLSNARGVSVGKMVKAAACRHYVEESLEIAKGDVGMDEYEVRSWVGWHHHITLSLLAMFFLVTEHLRMKKNTSAHGAAGAVRDGVAPRPGRDHSRSPATHRQPNHTTTPPQ